MRLVDRVDSMITGTRPGRTFRKLARIVFTCAVPRFDQVTRRHVLGAAGLTAAAAAAAPALAGCSSPPPPKTVDQTVAQDATIGPLYTETTALITAYDQAITDNPALAAALGQLREEHRQHAIALAGLMGAMNPSITPGATTAGPSMVASGAPPAPPPPNPSASAIAGSLSTAEKTAQGNAASACLAATGDRVVVLASIAACRSTHVAALAALR
jgi:hypothetical protein